MRITRKQLNSLPVYTESEVFLGYVVDFELDIDTHQIVQYHVSKMKIVNELLNTIGSHNALLISASQVRSITVERMVVDDAVKPVEEDAIQADINKSPTASPALSFDK